MVLETVYAIHSFEAENDDEIPFQAGEPIIILEKDDLYGDSWWKGKNIRGQIGLFPMTYISTERPLPLSPINVPSPSTTNDSTKENLQPATPTSTLNMNESDLDLPLPPFRMPSPSIDETIDDIQNKLQRMTVRIDERQVYQNRLNQQQNNLWSQKNGRSSDRLFMASSSGSSTTSSRVSSTGKQYSSPYSQFESVGSTRKVEILSSPTTTVNGRQSTDHPVTWDVNQVCMWLSEMGFESEVHRFVDNDITGDVLIGLTKETLLNELNISSYGKRVHIMKAISELRSQCGDNNDNDDVSDLEDIQSTTYYQDSIINRNNLYSNQGFDSTVNLSYGMLPQVNEIPNYPKSLIGTPKLSPSNYSRNYPPTYYTYSQRVDDAEGANIETVYKPNKKEKLLKLIGKRNTDQPIKKKDKSRTNSTGGWDFQKDEEIKELMNYKRIKNQSLPAPVKNRPIDRNSFVGSQLGLPKRSTDVETNQRAKSDPLPDRNTDYFYENIDDTGELNEESLKTIGAPDFEGWLLKKQGDKYKTWKSRYCILKGANLYYFKNDKEIESSNVKGFINLTGFRIIPDENILPGKYGFKLIHDIERSHYFAHDDVEQMKTWMKAMIKATISRDSKAPVISSSNITTVPLSEARKLTPRPPDPRRPSVSSSPLNKVASPILRPTSPLSQRTGSPIPTRPLSPALQSFHNSSSPLMRPFTTNRSTMGFF